MSDYVKIVPLDWCRFVFNDGKTFDYSTWRKSMEKLRNFQRKIMKDIIN